MTILYITKNSKISRTLPQQFQPTHFFGHDLNDNAISRLQFYLVTVKDWYNHQLQLLQNENKMKIKHD